MPVIDTINADIADIDAQIASIREEALSRVKALQAKKAALVNAAAVITPELEAAVAALQGFGLLRNL